MAVSYGGIISVNQITNKTIVINLKIYVMIRNMLLTSLRFFIKHKAYSFTNVIGLSIGLATCVLIFLFVQDELSYDRYHNGAERIYRLESYYLGEGREIYWAATTGALLPTVMAKYPEIETGVKFHYSFNTSIMIYGDRYFKEPGIIFADSTFFEVFSFELIKGNPDEALSGPGKIVLSETAARKYFGEEEPMGKIIRMESRSYMVSAVVKDIPENSHFHFDLVISLDDLRQRYSSVDGRVASNFYSYVKLRDEKMLPGLEEKTKNDIWELLGYTVSGDSSNVPEGYHAEIKFKPITEIHLNSKAEKELESNGDITTVYLFTIVAVFVLIIACINYMNLATARSATRGKEIGVKKVLGSNKSRIFNQFMAESFMLCFLAMIIAIVIVDLMLPVFNETTGKQLSMGLLANIPLLVALLVIWIAVSFISGSYPALFLSGFNPIKVLYSNTNGSAGGKTALHMRRGLVIFQFMISVLLIIGVITIYRQLSFVHDRHPGFDKENVVVIPLAGAPDEQKKEVFKNELRKNPDIVSVCGASSIPGQRIHVLPVRFPDIAEENLEGNEEGDDYVSIRTLSTDLDVMKTFGFEVVQGRGFSQDHPNDAETGFLFNEAAIRYFEIDNPIGKRVEYQWGIDEPKKGRIIGIVKDFNYASVHNEVEPLMIHVLPVYDRYLGIRVNSQNTRETLNKIENAWIKAFPNVPFDHFFLDSYYDNMYTTESNLGKVMLYFSILAVFIASLGLIGLASYIIEQRKREIGIRKVLGATIPGIIQTLSKEFVLLVVLANVLAWIPAWIYLENWLDGFVFRTRLSGWVFLMSAVFSLMIAIFIVGFQSYRAGSRNPVKALRAE